MSKVLLFVLIGLMSICLITAASTSCNRHGSDCNSDSQCCGTMKCHRYARKCQVQITQEDLMAQQAKILGRKGKDY